MKQFFLFCSNPSYDDVHSFLLIFSLLHTYLTLFRVINKQDKFKFNKQYYCNIIQLFKNIFVIRNPL